MAPEHLFIFDERSYKREINCMKGRSISKLKSGLKILGPGLITGSSDDDPSGIATYSQVGAQFGWRPLPT